MTVVYTHEVATGSRGLGNFGKLLARWRGSIYKLVIPDLILYAICYYIVNCFYRFYLLRTGNTEYIKKFQLLVEYCANVSKVIPLQFVLGFYVSQIVTRWWSQFMTIPWPDTLAVISAAGVQGHDDRGRMMRRTMLRYINLCLIMIFTMVSPQARKRFPSLEYVVEAGILLPHEKLIIDHLNEKLEGPKYYVPIVWAGAIAAKARKEGRIRDDVTLYHFIKELCKFRAMAGDILSYDWVAIPIVYTQVVTLATYVYFAACLFGNQMIPGVKNIDIYVPVFHFLEFFFLMGWLKVAETMVNPFGEDDDDFEVNWLIDRNFLVSYMIVDEMNTEFPEMVKDQYWDTKVPDELYYTEGALKYKSDGYAGSAAAAKHEKSNARLDTRSVVLSTGPGDNRHKGVASLMSTPHHTHPQHPHPRQDNLSSAESYANLYDRTFVPKQKDSDTDMEEKKPAPKPAV